MDINDVWTGTSSQLGARYHIQLLRLKSQCDVSLGTRASAVVGLTHYRALPGESNSIALHIQFQR